MPLPHPYTCLSCHWRDLRSELGLFKLSSFSSPFDLLWNKRTLIQLNQNIIQLPQQERSWQYPLLLYSFVQMIYLEYPCDLRSTLLCMTQASHCSPCDWLLVNLAPIFLKCIQTTLSKEKPTKRALVVSVTWRIMLSAMYPKVFYLSKFSCYICIWIVIPIISDAAASLENSNKFALTLGDTEETIPALLNHFLNLTFPIILRIPYFHIPSLMLSSL